MYGIKNCDRVKAALKWLDNHQITYTFHNYKKQGVDIDALNLAIQQHGWKNAINRSGTAWRKLPYETKNEATAESVVPLAVDTPSIVKRPLLIIAGQSYLGFKEDMYAEIFN